MNFRQLPACIVGLILVICVASCSSSNPFDQGSQGDQPALKLAALEDIEDTTKPTEVDSETWDSITTEFCRVVSARGTVDAPQAGTRVDDLLLEVTKDGTPTFTWTYKNAGDYNLDGIVNASDITPVGVYWDAAEGDENWPQAMVADGNGNGRIELGDITPVGQNYKVHVDGYVLERRSVASNQSWFGFEAVPLEAGVQPVDGGLPVFTFTPEYDLQDCYFRVTASDGYHPSRNYSSSDQVTLLRNVWNSNGQSGRQNYTSPFIGPDNPEIIWSLDLPVDLDPATAVPVIGPAGDVVLNGPYTVYCFSAAGEFRWLYPTKGAPTLGPVNITPGGYTCILTDLELVTVAPCGSVCGKVDIPFTYSPVAPVMAPGQILIGCSSGDETSATEFTAINLEGEVLWTVQPLAGENVTRLAAGDELVYFSGPRGVYSYDLEGNPVWDFPLNREPHDYQLDVEMTVADNDFLMFAYISRHWGERPYWQVLRRATPDGVDGMTTTWESETNHPLSALSQSPTNQLLVAFHGNSISKWNFYALALHGLSAPDHYLDPTGPARYLPVTSDKLSNHYVPYTFEPHDRPGETACTLRSIDFTGKHRWALYFPDADWFCSPIAIGPEGNLYAVTNNGQLHAVAEGMPTIPAAPTGLAASDGTYSNQVELTWDEVPGADGYYAYRQSEGDTPGYTPPAKLLGYTTGTHIPDATVTDATVHEYWVVSANAAGESGRSNIDTGYMAE